MITRLTELTEVLTESQLALRVKDSAEQLWLAGLGAYVIAQEEGGKVFTALTKKGEAVEARALKLAEEKMAIVTGTASETLERVEHVLDDGLARTLDRLGVPSKRDINKLSRKLHELVVVVEELAEQKAAPAPVTKTVAVAPRPFAKPESTITEEA